MRPARLETAWTALGLLIAASVLVRFAGSTRIPSPWIAPDEMIYALLGRSLWQHGTLSILGSDTPFYSLVYPALVGGPLSLGDRELGFRVLQALQAVVVSATAVPVYLWARSLVRPRLALLAAALALLPPALAYSGLVMSEVAFYPIATLALWALARALARPTLAAQGLLVGALVLAVATRVQALVLIPVLLLALALDAATARSLATVRRFGPALAGLGALAGVWGAWRLQDGGPWTKVLGAYAAAGDSGYAVGGALQFVAYHAADALLLVGAVPLLAVLVLGAQALLCGEPDALARAYLATALAYTLLLVVEVGVFASRHVGGLAERDLVSLAPVLFVGFALWLSRGAPRPQPLTSIVAFAAVAPAVLLPVQRLANANAVHDALMTIPLWHLATATSNTVLVSVWTVGVAAVVLLFVVVPARFAPALAGIVAVTLVGASIVSTRELAYQSTLRQERYFSGQPQWIDEAAPQQVAYLYAAEPDWDMVWQNVFWNDSLTSVLHLPGLPLPGPIPQRAVAPRFDGRFFTPAGAPVSHAWVVAPSTVTFRGERIARVVQRDTAQSGLGLWRTTEPLRVSTWARGFLWNGDFAGSARVDVYDCAPGRLELTLLGKDADRVDVLFEGRLLKQVPLQRNGAWTGSVPTPHGAVGGKCTYELQTPALTGSTRVEFVRD